ncbi:MAG: hypothetical protein ACK5NK_06710 [Niabella sp.]
MAKIIPIFTLFIFFAQKLHAQVTISGSVIDSVKSPVAFATITAKRIQTGDILGYSLTDEEGRYIIKLTENLDSIIITFSSIDYAEIEKHIKCATITLDFYPKTISKILDGVTVTNPPISVRSDILNYNVSSFLSKNDRTLSDVLKKMPGIEVDAVGRVKFQGQYINKFYVEGKDLMEGNYGMINIALPAGDAKTVQVLQHHQPVRMLKDKVYSPYAAINIKLKKDVSLTGRAKLGIGFSPFLHEVDLTPMMFSKKFQALLGLKSNNIGESLNENIENAVVFDVYEGVQEKQLREEWLSVSQAQLPAENRKRFLFNSDYLMSANYLTGLSKNLELRTNVNLLKSNISMRGGNENVTLLNTGDTILTTHSSMGTKGDKYLNAKITLQNNAENSFFRNTTFIKKEQAVDEGIMIQQGNPFQQTIHDRFRNFQNSFSAIVPIDKAKRYSLNIMSMISHNNGTPEYFVTPVEKLFLSSVNTENDSSLLQVLRYRNTVLNNSISIGFAKKKITFIPRIKYNFTNNKMLSNLFNNINEKVNDSNWINDMQLSKNQAQVDVNINYFGEEVKFSAFIPISSYQLSLQNGNNSTESIGRVIWEPQVVFSYTPSIYWEFKFSANRNARFSDVKELHKGNIFSTLNQISNQAGVIQTINNTLSPGVYYKNPFSNLFINTTYSYSKNMSDGLQDYYFLPNGQVFYNQLKQKNSSKMQSFAAQVGKFYNSSNTNLSLTGSTTSVQSQLLLNGLLSTGTIKNYNVTAKVISSLINKLYFDYSIQYEQYYNASDNHKSRFSQISQSGNIIFSPSNRHSLKLYGDNIHAWHQNSSFSYTLLDLVYQFSIPKNKIDIELGYYNILNQKTYKRVFVDRITTSSYNYYLSPAQLLLSVAFNLR